MNNKYNNDDLNILYFLSSKTDHMEFLFKTEYEQAYGMGHELYLFKKTDKNSQDFKLYNLGNINSCNDQL